MNSSTGAATAANNLGADGAAVTASRALLRNPQPGSPAAGTPPCGSSPAEAVSSTRSGAVSGRGARTKRGMEVIPRAMDQRPPSGARFRLSSGPRPAPARGAPLVSAGAPGAEPGFPWSGRRRRRVATGRNLAQQLRPRPWPPCRGDLGLGRWDDVPVVVLGDGQQAVHGLQLLPLMPTGRRDGQAGSPERSSRMCRRMAARRRRAGSTGPVSPAVNSWRVRRDAHLETAVSGTLWSSPSRPAATFSSTTGLSGGILPHHGHGPVLGVQRQSHLVGLDEVPDGSPGPR